MTVCHLLRVKSICPESEVLGGLRNLPDPFLLARCQLRFDPVVAAPLLLIPTSPLLSPTLPVPGNPLPSPQPYLLQHLRFQLAGVRVLPWGPTLPLRMAAILVFVVLLFF